jgi:lipoprotein LprG
MAWRARWWALVALVSLTFGCSTAAPEPGPTAVTPAERLAQVKTVVDAASSVHLTLTSTGVPDEANGVLGLAGVGTHPPAFKGTISARMAGVVANIEVVALSGVVHVKLPLTTIYRAVDPATLGAPDPAELLAADHGVTSLLTATQSPTLGSPQRIGSEVVATYAGSLPGQAVVDLFGIGTAAATYAVTFGVVEPAGQLRTVQLTGPFYGAASATYLLTLDRYGEPVTITAP